MTDEKAIAAVAALRASLGLGALLAPRATVDVAAMLVPVVKREGLDRPQAIGVPVAAAVSVAWLRVLRR